MTIHVLLVFAGILHPPWMGRRQLRRGLEKMPGYLFEQVPLDGYPRWDNPYLQAAFGDLRYAIAFEGMRLELDFANGVRKMGE
jgi:hypothetical protein